MGSFVFLILLAKTLLSRIVFIVSLCPMKQEGKEQKEKLLRSQITGVALQAYMKEGIRAVTMDEVASLLGISKRTLYEVFPDKESLIISCMHQLHEEHMGVVCQIESMHDNVIDIILSFYRYTVEAFSHVNPTFFLDFRRYPSVQEAYKEGKCMRANDTIAFFKRGVEEGLLREDVNFEITQELLDYQFEFLSTQSDLFTKYSYFDVYESIFFNFLRGLATEKGLLIVERFVEEYKKIKKNK